MRGLTICLSILVGVVALSSCQMFQYSRGWRPGKRNEATAQESVADASIANLQAASASPTFNFLVRCLQAINAWESVHAAADTLELGRVASHFLDVLEHCQIKEGYWAPAP